MASIPHRELIADLFHEEGIDGRVALHDSNHVEVKLDYDIEAGSKSKYRVETYFFIPRALGINKHTYAPSQFYSDVQNYIRFKTPSIPLRTVADPEGSQSPLRHLRDLVDALYQDPRSRDLHRKLSYELRMFGCVTRANIRDQGRGLQVRIQELPASERSRQILVDDIRQVTNRFLDDLGQLMDCWRALRPDLLDEAISQSLGETYQYVDEYLSLVIEYKLTALVEQIDNADSLASELPDVRSRLRDHLLAERGYREGAGYETVVRDDGDNEHFVFRQGMLKKFVMSVLWLEIDKEKEGRGAANVGAAVAAGAAMFFTLIATIVNLKWWMVNTWGFIIAATITYILKDRIKEWLKHFFSKKMTRFLADYSVQIRDPITGANIGRCREAATYLSMDSVPADVMAQRRKSARVSIEPLAKPEVVLKYEKSVRLQGKDIIERLHLEDYDLNDIMRFAVWQFLVRADDPLSDLPTYDAEEDQVDARQFRKVYHVNIVMVFHRGKDKANGRTPMRRIRVIFDKNGIRRLEEVE